MKKYLKIILLVGLLFIIGFKVWQAREKPSTLRSSNRSANQEISATLKINNGSDPRTFDISDFIGKTALEATESKTEVLTNGTGVNSFITSINGRSADSKKQEFWELVVNGSQAQVGAGSYIIQNHDEIQWKISNY